MSIEDYQLEEEERCEIFEHLNTIAIMTPQGMVELTKRDAIALAKHFELTIDDLK